MSLRKSIARMLYLTRMALSFVAMMQFSLLGPLAESSKADDVKQSAAKADNSSKWTAESQAAVSTQTRTPIKHVIIIIGENRTFDHIFATYQPKPGETVNNLLSEGIIKEDGTPGANYALANQFSADIT